LDESLIHRELSEDIDREEDVSGIKQQPRFIQLERKQYQSNIREASSYQ
jgi:hypothetical protein